MSERNTILIAEDADINRELLSSMFEEQYNVLEAENGQVAIECLDAKKDEIACLLLDLIMPVKNGFDVMEYMHETKLIDTIPIILITGDDSKQTEETAYNFGASDLIYKPYNMQVVMRRVKNIVDLYAHKNSIEQAMQEESKKVREQAQEIRKNNVLIIDALGKIVEYRTNETHEHTKRVQAYTKLLLKYAMQLHPELHLTHDDVHMIVRAAAVHDIGKLGIPDEVLLKHTNLTDEDIKVKRSHTTVGCEILEFFSGISNKKFYQYCYDVCRYHHERWDGSGYPEQLKGDAIPVAAQLVALADAYDSLVGKRMYNTPYTHPTAVQEIVSGALGEFSPLALECFDLAKEEFYQLDLSEEVSML